MDTYTNYDCDLDSVMSTIEEKGVAVVPGVLSSSKCEELRSQAWDSFNQLIGLSFEDPSSYENLFSLYPGHSMMLQHFSFGHMQWIWDIRQDEQVSEVFSRIWDTPKHDLLVSFDALSFHMPPEVTGKGWFKDKMWIHTDQSDKKQGFHCIQGSVNLYPVNEGDGTLGVLEGSHKFHTSFFADNDVSASKDWFKIRTEDYDYFYDRGCKFKRVLAQEGSLTLWDSRTFHQGCEPLKERTQQNFRLVCYISMTPRNKATPKVLEKKQKAFRDLRMTTHWAHEAILIPKKPHTWGKPMPQIDLSLIGNPNLTPLGQRLAGF